MIPFSPPKIYKEIIDEVVDSLCSGWITTGPKTALFENKLSKYIGINNILCVNSCTSGLYLMLKWYGIGEGDEVIVPAYTYCATANVILHCGATPVLVDITSDFIIDVKEVRKKITSKTKAVIPVDIGGLPCDYEELLDLLNSKNTKKIFNANNEIQDKLGRPLLLADAAHSIGAIYKNKAAGQWADATCFSFHAVKNLTTAEGGAICINLPKKFNNELIYKNLRIKSLHGQTKDAFAKTKIGGWEYDIIEAGFKFNMPDILAAIGLVEIDRYNETLRKREEIFKLYTERLSNLEWAVIPKYFNDTKTSSYHLYLLRIANFDENNRNKLIENMSKKGISTNVHYKPLPLLSLYRDLGYEIKDYPKSISYYQREISLPVYYDLKIKDAILIVNTLISEVNKIKLSL